MHTFGQGLRVAVAAADVGEDQQGMLVEDPVALEFLVQAGGQRDDPILVSLAVANEELVLGPFDVVDGQAEAFAKAQAAGVDEFDRGPVAAEADVGQQGMDLRTGQDGGENVVVLGADLPEDGPVGVTEKIDKELTGSGESLADGLRPPVLLQLDEQEVVAQLDLREESGVDGEVLVDESELAVVGMPGAIGVVAEGESLGKLAHGVVGMLVIDGIDEVPGGGAEGRGWRLWIRSGC